MATIDCPVDFIQVNENRVRLNALWVLLLLVGSLFIHTFTLPLFLFLAVDFFLRAFNFGKYSPINILSGIVIKNLKIGNKPIDQAPKRFAAGIGFALSLLAVVLYIFHYNQSLFVLTIVFAAFAMLESFFSFCAGCHVYSFLLKAKIIK